MILALLITLWILKMGFALITKKTKVDTDSDKTARFIIALVWPALALAKVFIWNTWASHWIGWPQINTLEQYVVTLFFL